MFRFDLYPAIPEFRSRRVSPMRDEDHLAPEFRAKRLASKLPRDMSDLNSCWEWQGSRTKDGYGKLTYRVKRQERIVSRT
jgi:hypothetical protein